MDWGEVQEVHFTYHSKSSLLASLKSKQSNSRNIIKSDLVIAEKE